MNVLDLFSGIGGFSLGLEDGLPSGMGRSSLSSYGNAVVPKIPEEIGRAIMTAHTSAVGRRIEKIGRSQSSNR